MPEPGPGELPERAVAVAGWLRRHPDVEAGPSVRGIMALAEVASAWQRQTGKDDLLSAALVCLPHRLRVRPGVDVDTLVRQAVLLAGLDGDGADGVSSDDDPGSDNPYGTTLQAAPSRGHDPAAGDGESDGARFTDEEARRILRDLFAPPPAEPISAGPTSTRPGRRSLDDEVVTVRPLRPGDRSRDFSVRHTIRASSHRVGAAPALRGVGRQPTARYDVVIALDVSASMGEDERPLVRPACSALARALLRDGHRVAALAFCEEAVVARGLSRWVGSLFPTQDYDFAYATNMEEGLDAGRRLLVRESTHGSRPHLVLVTDAEATSFNDRPNTWNPATSPWGFGKHSPLVSGPLIDAARFAATQAAARCRHQGITVSVLYPDDRSDIAFASHLARTGGGRCQALRP